MPFRTDARLSLGPCTALTANEALWPALTDCTGSRFVWMPFTWTGWKPPVASGPSNRASPRDTVPLRRAGARAGRVTTLQERRRRTRFTPVHSPCYHGADAGDRERVVDVELDVLAHVPLPCLRQRGRGGRNEQGEEEKGMRRGEAGGGAPCCGVRG